MSFLDKEMEESGTKTKKSLLKGYNKIQQMINNLPVEDVWVFNFAGINYYVTVPVTANKIHICKATGTTTSDKHALLWESPLQSICGKHDYWGTHNRNGEINSDIWCEDYLTVLRDFAFS